MRQLSFARAGYEVMFQGLGWRNAFFWIHVQAPIEKVGECLQIFRRSVAAGASFKDPCPQVLCRFLDDDMASDLLRKLAV